MLNHNGEQFVDEKHTPAGRASEFKRTCSGCGPSLVFDEADSSRRRSESVTNTRDMRKTLKKKRDAVLPWPCQYATMGRASLSRHTAASQAVIRNKSGCTSTDESLGSD